jgi:hypothetical protein
MTGASTAGKTTIKIKKKTIFTMNVEEVNAQKK